MKTNLTKSVLGMRCHQMQMRSLRTVQSILNYRILVAIFIVFIVSVEKSQASFTIISQPNPGDETLCQSNAYIVEFKAVISKTIEQEYTTAYVEFRYVVDGGTEKSFVLYGTWDSTEESKFLTNSFSNVGIFLENRVQSSDDPSVRANVKFGVYSPPTPVATASSMRFKMRFKIYVPGEGSTYTNWSGTKTITPKIRFLTWPTTTYSCEGVAPYVNNLKISLRSISGVSQAISWYRNGVIVPGSANATTLQFTGDDIPTVGGTYLARIDLQGSAVNGCRSSQKWAKTIGVQLVVAPMAVTLEPPKVCDGDDLAISVPTPTSGVSQSNFSWKFKDLGSNSYSNIAENSNLYSSIATGVSTNTLNLTDPQPILESSERLFKVSVRKTHAYCAGGTTVESNGVSISVVNNPTITPSTGQVCKGASLTLTGSGTPDATSPWVSSNSSDLSISNVGVAVGEDLGSSTITYKDNNGCTATSSYDVIGPSITPTISSLCVGLTKTLVGSGTPDATTPWESGIPASATVSSSGLITGVSAGANNIVTYKDDTGCTASVTFTVNDNPSVVTTTQGTVCEPATVDLTASAVTTGSDAGLSYAYYSDASATTVLASANAVGMSGDYYIQGTNSTSGCVSNVASVTVTIVQQPSVVITAPSSVCQPATVDLTATAVTAGSEAGLSYAYYSDATATTVLASANSISSSGNYYIQGVNSTTTCLSDIITVAVAVNPKPSVVTTAPSTVCEPTTVDLTASTVTAGSSAGLSFAYYSDAAGITALASSTALGVGSNATTTYYIRGTNTTTSCLSDVIPVAVTINSKPSVVTTSPSTVCEPATVDLTATAVTAGSDGGLNYAYFSDVAGTTALTSSTAVSVGSNATTTYYIQGTNPSTSCPSDVVPVAVTINPTPEVLTTDQSVCFPSTVDLTATSVTAGSDGGLSYAYFSDVAGTAALASSTALSSNGTYYIRGTNTTTSCPSDVIPVAVTINSKPSVVTTPPSTVCEPATVDLTATAVTAGSESGLNYAYFSDAAGTTALTSSTALGVGSNATTTYYIRGTNTTTSCLSDVVPVAVTINFKPSVVTTPPSTVCEPATVDLTATAVTAGSESGLNYAYFSDVAGTTALTSSTALGVGSNATTTYYIRGTNTTTSCPSDVVPVAVTINSKPSVVTTPPSTVCEPATVDLTATAVTTGSEAGLNYAYFSDAAGTTALTSSTALGVGSNATTTYYIRGTNTTTSCPSDVVPVAVTINSKPSVVTTPPSTVCEPATVDLTATAVTTGSEAGLNYAYFSDAAGTTALTSSTALGVGSNATTTYYIRGTNTTTSCPSDVVPVAVTINFKPSVVTTPPSTVCEPATVDLTASAVTAGSESGLNYAYFSDAAGTTALTSSTALGVGSNATTTYYIRGTNTTTSCPSDVVPVAVTINFKPSVVTTPPSAACEPATVDLTATAVTAGSESGLNYAYFSDAAGTTALTSSTALGVGSNATTTYYIRGTNTTTSCPSDVTPVDVTINFKPLVVTTPPSTVCEPATVDLTATAVTTGSESGLNYAYFSDAAGTTALTSSTALSVGSNATTTYYIRGTNTTTSCPSDVVPVAVTINFKPSVVTTPPSAVCEPATVDLTATAVTTGSEAGLNYAYFSDAAGTTALTSSTALGVGSNATTTYYIRGTNTTTSCPSDVVPVAVTINFKPSVVTTPPSAACEPATVDLTATAVTTGSESGLNYAYFSDAAGTTALTSSTALGVGSNATTTYYIRGTNTTTSCPSDVTPVDVTINFKPLVVTTPPSTVCEPATVDLTATAVTTGSEAGLNYAYFSDAAGTTALTSSTALGVGSNATTTYYIRGTNTTTSCPSDVVPVAVTINSKPSVVTTPPSTVCEPATVDLTATAVTTGSEAGLNYAYFSDAAGITALTSSTALSVGSNATTTYYIRGTNTTTSCPSDVVPVVVTINSKPSVVTTPPSTVCEPATVDLTATAVTTGSEAGLNYAYFSDAAGTTALTSSTAVSVGSNATTTYYIRGTNTTTSCPSDVVPVAVTINFKPSVVTTPPSTVCEPATVDLTATAVTTGSESGLNYAYFSDAAGTTALTSFTALGVGSNATTTYYIRGTNTTTSCPSDVVPVAVTINSKPSVVTTPPSAACEPATVDLTATAVTTGSEAGLNYAYFSDAAGTTALASSTALGVGANATTTYYIRGTNTTTSCPSDVVPVAVTINSKPSVVTTPPSTVCEPATVDLTATAVTTGSEAGLNYAYFSDAAGTTALASSTALGVGSNATTTYYIRGTNTTTSCPSDVVPVAVTINPKPSVVTTSPSAVCEPATVDLTATTVTAGSEAGLNYAYFSDAAGTTALASSTALGVGSNATTTYYIRGTNTTTSCPSDVIPVAVTINFKPSVVTTSPSAACEPATVDLTATAVTAGSESGLNYAYFSDAAGTTALTSSTALSVGSNATTTYYIRGTNTTTSCPSDVIPVAVTINSKPSVVTTPPSTVCEPATVDLTAIAVTAGSEAGLNYAYFSDAAGTTALTSSTAVSVGSNATTTYYIRGTNTTTSCPSDVVPVAVTINFKPSVVTTPPSTVCEPATVDLTATAVTAGSESGLNYAYFSDAAGTTALTSSTALGVGSNATTTYYIRGTNTTTSCLSDVVPVAVTINSKPSVVTTSPSTVCEPATVDLTAIAVTTGSEAGLNYAYFSDAAGTTALTSSTAVSVGSNATTTYYIRGTNTTTSCPSDVVPVAVTINFKPSVVTTAPSAVCEPATVDLTATVVTTGSEAGLNYAYFSDAAGTTALTSSTALGVGSNATTTYYIRGTNTTTSCPSDVIPVAVTINFKPSVVTTSPSAACEPATVDLTATAVTAGSEPGLNYAYFSDAAGTTVLASSTAVSVGSNATTTYYIRGTNTTTSCPSDVIPVVVTINSKPSVVTTSPSAVCEPATVDLTAIAVTAGSDGGLNYAYFSDAAGTTALTSFTALGVGSNATTTYYIRGTNTTTSCPSDVTPVDVTINFKPLVVTTSPSAVCEPATVDLTATTVTAGSEAGLNYAYFSDAAGTTALASSTALGVGSNATTTYYIRGTNTTTSCPSDVIPVAVTINSKPSVVTTPPSAVCEPATVDLTAIAVTAGSESDLSYAYFSDAAGTTALTSFTALGVGSNATTTYYIRGTNTTTSCPSDVTPVDVTINFKPLVVATAPSAVCEPATVDLTATAVTAGSESGLSYAYFSDAAGTTALTSSTAVSVGSNATTTYYIRGTNTTTSCPSDVTPVDVTINFKPLVVATSPSAACEPATVDLTATAVTAGSESGLNYAYFSDAAGTTALASSTALSVGSNATTTYYIRGTNTTTSCPSDVIPVVVTINSKPSVVTTSPSAVCEPATVDLTAIAVTAGSESDLSYAYFSDAAGTTALTSFTALGVGSNATTTYYIRGTNTTTSCPSDVTPVDVTINFKPLVVATAPSAVCEPATVDLTATAVTAGSEAGLNYAYFSDAAGTTALTSSTALGVGSNATTTYYIRGTNTTTSCPSDVIPVAVTINFKPSVVTTSPSAACEPATVDLTATAVTAGSESGLNYAYFSDAAGTTALTSFTALSVGSNATTTYYIRGTNTTTSCPSDVIPVVVTINSKPSVVTTSPSAVCEPATVDLTAIAVTAGSESDLSYAYFSDAAGTTALTSFTALGVGSNATTTYYIRGTNTTTSCPSDVTPVDVTINFKPLVVTTSPSAVCEPATVDLTATTVTAGSEAGLNYAYFSDAAGTTALASSTALGVGSNATTTYYIRGTNTTTSCPSDVIPVAVTINSKPSVVTTPPSAVCEPATVDLTAIAVTAGSEADLSYAYFSDAAGTTALTSFTALGVGSNATTTYYIRGTNTTTSCPSDVTPVDVTINFKPLVVATAPSAVCEPATVDLTATAVTAGSESDLNYAYFSDAAGTTALTSSTALGVGFNATTTYYIRGTNTTTSCPSDVTPVDVTINFKPLVVATSPSAACEPATVDLTATAVTAGSEAGLNYAYFSDAAGTTALASSTALSVGSNATTTYYIRGTNTTTSCPSDVIPVVVTINSKPSVVTTAPSAVCEPATVDLTAIAVTAGSESDLSYAYFSDAAGTTALTSFTALGVGSNATTTYYIRGTNTTTSCPSDVTPVDVTINFKPLVVTTAPSAACEPATVDLTATAVTTGSESGLNYAYFSDAAGTTALTSSTALSVGSNATTTYYIRGTNTTTSCPSDVIPVVVTINSKPSVVTTSPSAVCEPATVDLTATAVTAGSESNLSYAYFSDAAGTTALTSSTAVSVGSNATTTYYIRGTNTTTSCPSDVTPVDVTINFKPLVVATAPSAVCEPATVDLTAIAVTAGSESDLSYAYFSDAAGTTALTSFTALGVGSNATTTYYIRGTNTTTSCPSDVIPVAVTINSKPSVVTTPPSTVCEPATVDLTATAVTTGSDGGLNYAYFSDAAGTTALTSSTALGVGSNATTTYYIRGTNTTTSCPSDVIPVVVTINSKPSVVTTSPSAICEPATVDLTAIAVTAGSESDLSYAYFSDAAGTTVLASSTAVSVGSNATTTYYIRGTNTTTSCPSDVIPVVVTINPKPSVVTTSPSAVCEPATVDLTAIAVTAGSESDLNYAYFSDAAGTTALASSTALGVGSNATTTYYIRGTNPTTSCPSDVIPVAVTINSKPSVVTTPPSAACEPATVDLTATAVTAGSDGGLNYAYFSDAAGTTALASSTALSVGSNATTTYYIRGTNTTTSCPSDVIPVAVTINSKPSVVTTAPSAVCEPATVDLTAIAVTAGSESDLSYAYFSDAAGTTALTSFTALGVGSNATTTYYIRGTNTTTSCPSDVTPVDVTINFKPLVVTTAPSAACEPATVDLTATAVTIGSESGLNYAYFSDAAGTTALASSTALGIGSNATTTYYIRGTNTTTSCPSDVVPVVVTINPKPSVVTTSPSAVCEPATVDLTAIAVTAGSESDLSYAYFSDAAGTTALASSTAVSVGSNATTTYYIRGTNTTTSCPSDVTPVDVIINFKPLVVTTAPSAACEPATVDLTAIAVTAGSESDLNYAYFSDAAGTTALTSSTALGVGSNATTTYYIRGTNTTTSCPSDVVPVAVTINFKPSVVTTSPSAVCEPATVDLTATTVTTGSDGGLNYAYFSDAAGTTALASSTALSVGSNATTTYYIRGTNTTTSCPSDVIPVAVTINSKPSVVTTPPSTVCEPATVDLTAIAVTAGSESDLSYAYFSDAAGTTALTSFTALGVGSNATTTYYIRGTNTTTSCPSDVTPVVVTINPIPEVKTTDQTVCFPSTVDLTDATVTSGSESGLSFAYYSDGGATIPLTSSNLINVSGTFYIRGTNTTTSCPSDVIPVAVTINLKPSVVTTSPSTVCEPATVDLTATTVTAGSDGGLNYAYFSDAAGTTTLTSSTALGVGSNATTTYYIRGTNTTTSCPSDVIPVAVTINPKPSVVTTAPSAVCEPATVDLTAIAVTAGSESDLNYAYFSDVAGITALESSTALGVGSNATTTYYIRGTNTTTSCPSDVTPVDVTINFKPLVVTTSPSTVCEPATVDLTAIAVTAGSDGGLNYAYFNDVAGTTALASSTAVSVGSNATTTYYIRGTNATTSCPSDVVPVAVTINPKPSVVTTSPSAVCEPATVDLTATAVTIGSESGLNYAYFSDAAGTTALTSSTAVSVGSNATTTYYIRGTNTTTSCPSDVVPVAVTINPIPEVKTTDQSVCFPNTVDLTNVALIAGSELGLRFAYYSDAIATIPLNSPMLVNVSGTYYVQGTNTTTSCPSDVTPVVVTINPIPEVLTTPPDAVCEPATVDLTAVVKTTDSSPDLSYKYYSNAVATTELESSSAISSSGTYYIQGKDITTYCLSDVVSVAVTINPKPIIRTEVPDPVCEPTTVDLTASTVVTGSVDGLIFGYYSDYATTTELGTPAAVSVSSTPSTSYYIQGTDPDTGCPSDVAEVVVTINYIPIVVVSDPKPVCAPNTVNLTSFSVTTGSDEGLRYRYFSEPFEENEISNPNSISTSGDYYIQGETIKQCLSDFKRIKVEVNMSPTVTPMNLTVLGGFDVQFNGTGIPNPDVAWKSSKENVVDIDDTGFATSLDEGESIITYIDNKGCMAESVINVKGNKIFPQSIEVGEKLTLDIPLSPSTSQTDPAWKSEDPNIAEINPITGEITGLLTGNTTIVFTDAQGNMYPIQITIELGSKIIAVEGFSPNGDGINDYLKVINPDPSFELKLDVYNRWGSLVYRDLNYQNNWFGNSNVGGLSSSSLLPVGTYFVVIESGGGKFRISQSITIHY